MEEEAQAVQNFDVSEIERLEQEIQKLRDTQQAGIADNSEMIAVLEQMNTNLIEMAEMSQPSFIVQWGPIVLLAGVILTIWNNWRLARRRATIDFIETYESGQVYRDANATFRKRRLADRNDVVGSTRAPKSGSLRELAETTDQAKLVDREHVNSFLNHHELLAIGMQNSILDYKFYRRWMKGSVLRDWKAARPYVQRERWKLRPDGSEFEYKGALWCRYEQLAIKWSKGGIPKLTASDGGKPEMPKADEQVAFGDQPNPTPPITGTDDDDCG